MQTAQVALHTAVEERHWWFLARRTILNALVRELLPAGRDHLIVDVGCGTGANIASLTWGYRCVGLDSSMEAIRRGRARFPTVRFVHGISPEALGDLAADADLFLLMDVIEHVSDDSTMLSRWLAAAKPGAHVLLTVPADPALWSDHDVSFGHFRRYDQPRLQRTWEGLPVSVRLLSYYNTRLYSLVWVARHMSRLLGRTWGAGGTDFHLLPAPINRLLQEIFAGETTALVKLLRGRRASGFSHGVSLIAVLRREDGAPAVRVTPPDPPADPIKPIGAQGTHAP